MIPTRSCSLGSFTCRGIIVGRRQALWMMVYGLVICGLMGRARGGGGSYYLLVLGR